MLKFAKKALLILGVLVIVAAAGLLLWEARLRTDSLNAIVSAAVNSKSFPNEYYNSTINGVWLSAAIAVVGGWLLGLGIGIPSSTFKQRYEKRQAELARKQAEAATKASSHADDTKEKEAPAQ